MTDVEKDISVMQEYIGYPNEYFHSIFDEFAPGMWDYVPCSEIACCWSYMAGNLEKIYVSNYAEGLYNLYRANGRFGSTPQPGAFIWFQYGSNTPEHTGRVVKIENGVVYTIEGNVGGIVQALSYPIDSWYIFGYGYPNYTNQQMDSYEVRTVSPAGENLPFYNTVGSGGYNSCGTGTGGLSGADVLNSDTGYAQGRMMEIYNQLFPSNPITSAAGNVYSVFNDPNGQNWYNIAVNNNFNTGNTPQYASVGVWYNARQNKGHVAVLENYVNGSWIISEGHKSFPTASGSWDSSYLRNDSNYTAAWMDANEWVLVGFIYPYNIPYPPPGPEPPTPPAPEMKEKKITVWLKRRPF